LFSFSPSLLRKDRKKMARGYIKIGAFCPRSFLFVIVANVGPGGTSRSLAVAYRQGDNYIKQSYFERVEHFVADTLAVIEILSDPANRALLEAERMLAKDWHCRSEGADKVDWDERPAFQIQCRPPGCNGTSATRVRNTSRSCLGVVMMRLPSFRLQQPAFCWGCWATMGIKGNGTKLIKGVARALVMSSFSHCPLCSVATAMNMALLF
jgi:hypothetical protein